MERGKQVRMARGPLALPAPPSLPDFLSLIAVINKQAEAVKSHTEAVEKKPSAIEAQTSAQKKYPWSFGDGGLLGPQPT